MEEKEDEEEENRSGLFHFFFSFVIHDQIFLNHLLLIVLPLPPPLLPRHPLPSLPPFFLLRSPYSVFHSRCIAVCSRYNVPHGMEHLTTALCSLQSCSPNRPKRKAT